MTLAAIAIGGPAGMTNSFASARCLRSRRAFPHCCVDPHDHRFVLINPAYQKLIGYRAVIGLPLREALPEVESQGFLGLLDEVFATGKPFIGRNMQIVLHPTHGSGGAEPRFLDFVYQPIKDASGNVTSIFVEGSDVTEQQDTPRKLLSVRRKPACAS